MIFDIKLLFKTLVLSFFVFSLSACESEFKITEFKDDGINLDFSVEKELKFPEWANLNENNNSFVKEFPIDDIDRVFVFKFLKADYDFEVLEKNTGDINTIALWQDEYPDYDFIVNGSFFNKEYNPTGGIILNNEGRIYSENGNNQYEGAVVINDDKELKIQYLPSAALNNKTGIKDVVVNFPFLIKSGNAYLKNDDPVYAQRTVVASDDNYIYFVMTDGRTFSLYGIMNWILENLETVDTALNLDGGSSTGFSYKLMGSDYINNSIVAIPNVITVKEK
jgi:hypothetical protein